MIYDVVTFITLCFMIYRYLINRFFSFYILANVRNNLTNKFLFLKVFILGLVLFVYIVLTACENKYFINDEQDKSSSGEKPMVISREFFKYLSIQLRETPYPGVENYTQYILTKLQIKPHVEIKSLRPEFGPVINDISSFTYRIEIPRCPNIITHRNSLFVAVISAPNYFAKRNVIRQTWLNHLQKQSNVGPLIGLYSFGFVVGSPANKETQERIETESKMYGDILQIDIMDSYKNLTLKVVALLKWVNDHCSQVDFVLKVDDDVYVNVKNLATIISSLDSTEPSVYGTAADGVVQREGKYYISFEDWPWSQYPVYSMGASVLLPGCTIKSLLAASQTTPYFPFEDTYLTGLCTSKAGIKVRLSDRMLVDFSKKTNFYFSLPGPCQVYNSITWLTDSVDTFNKSHWATNDFYNNVTKCIIKDTQGMKIAINPMKITNFPFTTK